MNLADQIKAALTVVMATKDELTGAVQALEADKDDSTLSLQVDELSTRLENEEKTLATLERAEKALALRTTAVTSQPAKAAPAIVTSYKTQYKPGDMVWRLAVASYLAFVNKKSVAEIIQDRYDADQGLMAVHEHMVHKSAVGPATTFTTGWAAELVRNDVQGFLGLLETTSIAAALATRGTVINFDGFDSVSVPRQDALPATPTEPAWVGEGGAIPLTQFSFGAVKLNRYKLAAISTFTRELANRSTPQIEGLLRVALNQAYSLVLDQAILSSLGAVTGVRPAGLLNGVTPLTAATGGGLNAFIDDIQALLSSLMASNLGIRPVLIMNSVDRVAATMLSTPLGEYPLRDELNNGRAMGIEVISSPHQPSKKLTMVDAAALATALDGPDFDVSDVATVVEANANVTPPTMAVDTSGVVATAGQVGRNAGIKVSGSAGAGTAGYTARSLWQTYSVGIRMICPTSWGLMRAGAVATIDAGTWAKELQTMQQLEGEQQGEPQFESQGRA